MICKHILSIKFLNEPELISWRTVQWVNVWFVSQQFLGNLFFFIESELICLHMNVTIVCAQLNGSKHFNCFGTQPADCNELFQLLLISGDYSSRTEVFPRLGLPSLTQGTDLAEYWLVNSPFHPIPTKLLLPLGSWVYCLAPEAPLIRRMPTGSKVFLALPEACGLCPCDRTRLKMALCQISPVVERKTNTEVLPSLTHWQSDWRSTPFYICCIILSLIYFVPCKPESCLFSGPFTGPRQ